jgi:cellulose synthase/poly-beta-1,6-N-acetylglucosamine synthase-like glycosyltransferase
LSHARVRAFHEARYEIISFIDDDNWVAPDWVRLVDQFFKEHPQAGAVGGCGAPAFENGQAPAWFDRFKLAYAAGPQYEKSGDITNLPTSLLWGAGLCVRSKIFKELEARGFQFLCTGRRGKRLTACEDVELCFAMRALGWHLHYWSALRYQHFIPPSRLTWAYVRNLYRGSGQGAAYVNIIKNATTPNTRYGRYERYWFFQVARILRRLIPIAVRHPVCLLKSSEGSLDRLQADALLGELGMLFRLRGRHEELFDENRARYLK